MDFCPILFLLQCIVVDSMIYIKTVVYQNRFQFGPVFFESDSPLAIYLLLFPSSHFAESSSWIPREPWEINNLFV